MGCCWFYYNKMSFLMEVIMEVILKMLIETADSMYRTATVMQKSKNPEIQRHGAEMMGASLLAKNWVEEIREDFWKGERACTS